MSGPVGAVDIEGPAGDAPVGPILEITDSRLAQVGEIMVRRALPRHGRRTIGAWCFIDHAGPTPLGDGSNVDVAPHPHIGLQTVTWLLSGEIVHRDSLGSEQIIRPGELNLMTAGHGVLHSEEHTANLDGELQLLQLWVAQPEATRDGPPAFEHHADLPQLELGAGSVGTLLVGSLGEQSSPARRDTDHVGIDLDLRADTVIPLQPDYEYGLVVVWGALTMADSVIEPGHLAYLGTDRDELALSPIGPTRALLIGGPPFPETVRMWWNFVARTEEELEAAYTAWSAADSRFGTVVSTLPRTEVGPPLWMSPGR
ncbi:MAG TPA: pirin family protein [Acidimicrobiales bacterium]|jgi:hypothetical protein